MDNTDNKQNKYSFTYAFKQQIMKAWQPVPTLKSTIILFVILTIFFLVFGIVLISYSLQIKEYSVRYDDKCTTFSGATCQVTINVKEKMESPVYIYYELDNFYQNHRRYVKSKVVDQLQGSEVSDLSDCDPVTKNKDIKTPLTALDGTTTLDPDGQAIPCGLIAKSVFTDTFKMYDGLLNTDTEITISSKGIAWPSDVDHKYKRVNNYLTRSWYDVEDERFMVWMRTAALPQFRKLWGIIHQDINKGEYLIEVTSNYDTTSFDSKKHIVLSTANVFGGQNLFLAISYLVVGGVCFIITIIFIIKLFTHQQQSNANVANKKK